MRRLFNDDKLEAEFSEEGFVRVPFIPAEKVARLKQLFFDTLPKSGGQITPEEVSTAAVSAISYDFTFIDKNPEYKRMVFDIITKEFAPEVKKYLAGYKPIIANFIRKKTDTGEVPLHQNWSFADEHKCYTVSIWCPLVDSTIDNGTLQVVPHSHKRFGEVRGPMIPWELDNIKDEIINKYLVPLETKAGDAIILDDSIVHYSALNKTNDLRLAIQLILIPEEMPSQHQYYNPAIPNSPVEVCEVDVDFYMNFNPWKSVEKKKIVELKNYQPRFIDEKEFAERLKGPRFDELTPTQQFNGSNFGAVKAAFFQNPQLQKQFDRDGYVIVPLLDEKTVDTLESIYRKVQPTSPDGFSSTSYNKDVDLKIKTSNEVQQYFEPFVNKLFKDYRPLGSTFLCKAPGNASTMPVHQDWTVVDEEQFDSVTMWIPLVDTNPKNGALRVLPGSHKFSKVLRSPTLPGAFTQVSEQAYDKMKQVYLKKGEAIIFSQALLHASPPNLSDKDRVAVTFGLVPEKAALKYYHKNASTGKVEEYAVPDDFFLRYNEIGSAPDFGTKKREFDYTWQSVTGNELTGLMSQYSNLKLASTKMKPLFKDPSIQQFFEKNGYVLIPMLNADEVKTLHDYFYTQNLVDHSGYGFNMSMEDHDKEKVKRIREKIFEVAYPKAKDFLDNGQVVTGSYVVKEPNPQGVVPPHQDWTFVDNEGEYCSVTCWIPLVDTTMDNGCMGVIKGSHEFFSSVRASPSPQIPTPLGKHLFQIFPYLEMFEMKAGTALIFDNRTFHASPPNITNERRLAVGMAFTQAEAKLVHYNLKQNGKKDTLQKYFVDDNFLLRYDNSMLSAMYEKGEAITGYTIAEELPYEWDDMSTDDLVERIKAAGNQFNVPLCERMAKLFNYNMDGSKKEEPANNEPEPVQEQPKQEEYKWVDDRPFLKKYTPLNIAREIKKRILA